MNIVFLKFGLKMPCYSQWLSRKIYLQLFPAKILLTHCCPVKRYKFCCRASCMNFIKIS